MQDFMDASENIANGDYSVRVHLKGPLELRRVGESSTRWLRAWKYKMWSVATCLRCHP